jgi:hypothetical protein
MYADLTRDTFDQTKHFSRVLIQQGRVPLDADLNEQTSILLHYQRQLAADLIGPHGGPSGNTGFKITKGNGTFTIGRGRYYVDGILVELLDDTDYFEQPHRLLDPQADPVPNVPYVVVLEVSERHRSGAEDESILEPALGGPDTATRAQIIWQVRAHPASDVKPAAPDTVTADEVFTWLREVSLGTMRARVPSSDDGDTTPCVLSPAARFRGLDNQLYRVEVHAGGTIDATGKPVAGSRVPTVKWSRENGSVVLPVRTLRADRAHVETLGRDGRLGVREGDWVEVLSDDTVRRDRPAPLASVELIDRDARTVELKADALPTYENNAQHPFLRRWDQRDPTRVSSADPTTPDVDEVSLDDGAVPIDLRWIELEDGIQVQFSEGTYRSGDYWLIPARTATGDILWPTEPDANGDLVASMRRPRGVERHAAPLAIVKAAGVTECRNCFEASATPCP